MTAKVEWKCPKCGATPDGCPKDKDSCQARGPGACMGFICECWEEQDGQETAPEHGETFTDPCKNANCYHCGWGGTFPVKPKGMQAWEKKALDAGWTMPEARAKELGLK